MLVCDALEIIRIILTVLKFAKFKGNKTDDFICNLNV